MNKELLSEVLGDEYTKFNHYEDHIEFNNLVYGKVFNEGCTSGSKRSINIYELQHKCIMHFYDDYIFNLYSYEIKVIKITAFKESEMAYNETWMDIPYDINQTFKACQWILENKGVNNV